MFDINFNIPQTDAKIHQCQSHKEGDDIVFTCPDCPGYERRMNLRTNKMTVVNAREDILHTGTHVSPILKGLNGN